MDYASNHAIPIERQRGNQAPYSMDANLMHVSFEGGELEDPMREPREEMWRMTCSPQSATR